MNLTKSDLVKMFKILHECFGLFVQRVQEEFESSNNPPQRMIPLQDYPEGLMGVNKSQLKNWKYRATIMSDYHKKRIFCSEGKDCKQYVDAEALKEFLVEVGKIQP